MIPYSSESHKQQYHKMGDVLTHTRNAYPKNRNETLLRNLYDTLCGRRITRTPIHGNKQHFAVKYNGKVDDILRSEQREVIVSFTFNVDSSIKQVDIYFIGLGDNYLEGFHQRLSPLMGFENMKHMKRRPHGTAKLIQSIPPNEVFAKRGM